MAARAMQSAGILGSHTKLALADADDVTMVQLPATAILRLLVDGHGLGLEQSLRFAAAVDDPRELQQLAKPDHRPFDRYLESHRSTNLAASGSE